MFTNARAEWAESTLFFFFLVDIYHHEMDALTQRYCWWIYHWWIPKTPARTPVYFLSISQLINIVRVEGAIGPAKQNLFFFFIPLFIPTKPKSIQKQFVFSLLNLAVWFYWSNFSKTRNKKKTAEIILCITDIQLFVERNRQEKKAFANKIAKQDNPLITLQMT